MDCLMGHWIEVRAFEDADVDAAAELLRERHERHRAAEPLLAPVGDARGLVASAWEKEATSGAVAVVGGEIGGYVIGSVGENEWWNRHAWVGLTGHAAREPELVRDLYRLAAERWVEEGAELHVALVPAVADLTEPWFRVAFAHMQAHGIRESGADPGPRPAGLTVRAGTLDDARTTPELLTKIWEHHTRSPTFTGLTVPPVAEFLADAQEVLAGSGVAYFVAERDGQVLGHLLLRPEEPDLARPPGSIYLAIAATLPDARGSGAGVALTEHALAWAREAGYQAVQTDWRVANLEASRFWPRRGFRETFYRFARRVNIG
jgi:ribosomal protein S18 acetylase RimI-like enzyme